MSDYSNIILLKSNAYVWNNMSCILATVQRKKDAKQSNPITIFKCTLQNNT